MLVIRYFRVGKKNQPFFKIVVTDKRKSTRGGRFTEEVGFLNPLKKEKSLKADRIKYWISKGAQPSDSLHNLLVQEKIIEGKKIAVHKIKKETAAAIAEKAAAAQKAAAPALAPTASAAPVAKPVEAKKPEAPMQEEKKPEQPKAEEPKPEPKSDKSPETKEAPKVEEK